MEALLQCLLRSPARLCHSGGNPDFIALKIKTFYDSWILHIVQDDGVGKKEDVNGNSTMTGRLIVFWLVQ